MPILRPTLLNSLLDFVPRSRLVMALRESFLALLPLFILLHLIALTVALAHWGGLKADAEPWSWLNQLRIFLAHGWPLAIGMALTIHLARAYEVDTVIACVLVLGLLLVAVQFNGPALGQRLVAGWSAVGSVLVPLLGVWMLRLLLRIQPRVEARTLSMISPALARTVVHILPFIVSFGLLSVVVVALPKAVQAPLHAWVMGLPQPVVVVLSVLVVNLLWWTGVHGAISWDLLTGNAIWLIPVGEQGAHLGDLLYGVVYPGGCGCSLALAGMLWRHLKDERDRHVLRWATPFAIFNVSEPLMFGLPVVGQRQLLLPFVLAPLAGAVLAWLAVEVGWLTIKPGLHWMMPVGLNSLAFSDEPGRVLVLQALVFALACAIYAPAVRRLAVRQSMNEVSLRLAQQLGVGPSQELYAEQRFEQSLRRLQGLQHQAQDAIRLVEGGSLRLCYQPKWAVGTGRVVGLEALLRLELPSGEWVLPGRFLPVLEQAGFGDMFDLWVLKQIEVDRLRWAEQGFDCPVAINLTATTLADDKAFQAVLAQSQRWRDRGLEIEMLESSLVTQPDKVRQHLDELRACGGRVLVDDFGTGYANLAIFHSAGVDAVKLDRSLLVATADPRGQQLYREMAGALLRMGYSLVAEGVETPTQEAFVASCGVQVLQGWWVSQPLLAECVPAEVAAIEARLA